MKKKKKKKKTPFDLEAALGEDTPKEFDAAETTPPVDEAPKEPEAEEATDRTEGWPFVPSFRLLCFVTWKLVSLQVSLFKTH